MSLGIGTSLRAEREPGVATAEQGQVMLDGPDGVSVTMTPDAAELTAKSLLAAATQARAQQDAGDPA